MRSNCQTTVLQRPARNDENGGALQLRIPAGRDRAPVNLVVGCQADGARPPTVGSTEGVFSCFRTRERDATRGMRCS